MLKSLIWGKLILRTVAAMTWFTMAVLILTMGIGVLLPQTDEVAFMSDRRAFDQWDIYLLDMMRGVSVPITDGQAPERFPAWSPDGSQIAYHAQIEPENELDFPAYSLFVMGATGGDQRIMGIADDVFTNDEAMVSWSPDGNSIAFHMGSIQYNTDFQIYIADVISGDHYSITNGIGDTIHADWSPDGTRMVFSAERYDTVSGTAGTSYGLTNIYLLEVDGNITNTRMNELRMRRLTDETTTSYFPAWSPDGSRIAYVSNTPGLGVSDIFVMDADGRNPGNLTNGRYFSSNHPEWTPDGRIMFAAQVTQDSDFDLYIMDADGRNTQQLTEGGGNDEAPDWRPRG